MNMTAVWQMFNTLALGFIVLLIYKIYKRISKK